MPNINVRFPYSDEDGYIRQGLTIHGKLQYFNPSDEVIRGAFDTPIDNNNNLAAASFDKPGFLFIDRASEDRDFNTGQKKESTFDTNYDLGTGKFHVSFFAKPISVPSADGTTPTADAVEFAIGFEDDHVARTNVALAIPEQWHWFCIMRTEDGTLKVFQDNAVILTDTSNAAFNLSNHSFIYLGETADNDSVNFLIDDLYILNGNVFDTFEDVAPPSNDYQQLRSLDKPAFAVRRKEDNKLYGLTEVKPPK